MSETDEYDFNGLAVERVIASSSAADVDETHSEDENDEDEDDEDLEYFWSGTLPYDLQEKLLEINRAFIEDQTPIKSDRPRKVKFNNRVRVRDISLHRLNPSEIDPSVLQDGVLSGHLLLDPDYSQQHDEIDTDPLSSTLPSSVQPKVVLSTATAEEPNQRRNTTVMSQRKMIALTRKTPPENNESSSKLAGTSAVSKTTTELASRVNTPTTSATTVGFNTTPLKSAIRKSTTNSKKSSDFSDAQNSLCIENYCHSDQASTTENEKMGSLFETSSVSDDDEMSNCSLADNKDIPYNLSEKPHDENTTENLYDNGLNHFELLSVLDKFLDKTEKSLNDNNEPQADDYNKDESSCDDNDFDTNILPERDDLNTSTKLDDHNSNSSETEDSADLCDGDESELDLYDISSGASDLTTDYGVDPDTLNTEDTGDIAEGANGGAEEVVDRHTESSAADSRQLSLQQCRQSSQDSALGSMEDGAIKVGLMRRRPLAEGSGDFPRRKTATHASSDQSAIVMSHNSGHDSGHSLNGVGCGGRGANLTKNRPMFERAKSDHSVGPSTLAHHKSPARTANVNQPSAVSGIRCHLQPRSTSRESEQLQSYDLTLNTGRSSHDHLYLWKKQQRSPGDQAENGNSNGIRPSVLDRTFAAEKSNQFDQSSSCGAYQFWLRKKSQQHKLELQIAKLKQASVVGGHDTSHDVKREVPPPPPPPTAHERSRTTARQRSAPSAHRSVSQSHYDHNGSSSSRNGGGGARLRASSSSAPQPQPECAKQSQCDQVFQLWLQKKRHEHRLQERIKYLQQEILAATTPARDPQRAYTEWLQQKKTTAAATTSSERSRFAASTRGRENYLRAKDVYAPDLIKGSSGGRRLHSRAR